jgi:hypothetical protein
MALIAGAADSARAKWALARFIGRRADECRRRVIAKQQRRGQGNPACRGARAAWPADDTDGARRGHGWQATHGEARFPRRASRVWECGGRAWRDTYWPREMRPMGDPDTEGGSVAWRRAWALWSVMRCDVVVFRFVYPCLFGVYSKFSNKTPKTLNTKVAEQQ